MVYNSKMTTDRGEAPTDKVWAIYHLYAQQFPVVISLNQRAAGDSHPYIVTIGERQEEFTRLSDDEVSWLLKKKVGVK